jgi:branched-subunit amino acid ABC-type transport system permease component
MRGKNRERRHGINRKRWWNIRCQGLRKERNTTLSLASGREELGFVILLVLTVETLLVWTFETLVVVRGEKRRRTEAATTTAGVSLIIEELLNVVDREEMFAIHGNYDGIPDLRDEDLGGVKTRGISAPQIKEDRDHCSP